MKMKIPIILMMMMAFAAIPAFAILDSDTIGVNITLNLPTNNSYNSSGNSVTNFRMNATVAWVGGANGMNVSNGTFVFVLGTNVTKFVNGTEGVNGSSTSASTGDFFFNISYGNLSEGTYSVHFMIFNETTAPVSNANQINSSKIAFTIDRSAGSVVISNPLSGSTVVPNANVVTIEYTPTDLNYGNCTLHINNQAVKSSASGTISPNVTSGALQRFTQTFSADNLTVRTAISCIDLAGNANSNNQQNNFTFNVLLGALSPAVRQQLISGGGGYVQQQQPKQLAFSGVSLGGVTSQRASNHFEKWAWAYAIVVVAGLIYVYRRKFK